MLGPACQTQTLRAVIATFVVASVLLGYRIVLSQRLAVVTVAEICGADRVVKTVSVTNLSPDIAKHRLCAIHQHKLGCSYDSGSSAHARAGRNHHVITDEFGGFEVSRRFPKSAFLTSNIHEPAKVAGWQMPAIDNEEMPRDISRAANRSAFTFPSVWTNSVWLNADVRTLRNPETSVCRLGCSGSGISSSLSDLNLTLASFPQFVGSGLQTSRLSKETRSFVRQDGSEDYQQPVSQLELKKLVRDPVKDTRVLKRAFLAIAGFVLICFGLDLASRADQAIRRTGHALYFSGLFGVFILWNMI